MKKGKFILGTLIGAAAGVLLSPVSGSEARKALGKKMKEIKIKIQDIDFSEVREEFEIKVEEIQNELSDLDKEKAIKLAKEKAKIIQEKSEELVKYAIKSGKPVLEKMANEAKEQTITVLKEILKKIDSKNKKTV